MISSGSRLTAGARLHHRQHRLAELVVRHAEHRDVGDRGVSREHALDLGRVDVGAARDDEVGAAVGDEQIPLVVETTEVPGREEAVPKRRHVAPGRSPVVEVEARAAHVDQADVASRTLVSVLVHDADLVPRPRPPDAPRLAHPLLRRDAREAALRRAVEFGDRAGREQTHDAALDVRRTGRRRVHEQADRPQIERLALLAIELHDAREVRGHHERIGDAKAFDQLQTAPRLEVRHHHRGGADQQMQLRISAGGGVIQRSRRQVDLALVQVPHLRHCQRAEMRRLRRHAPLDGARPASRPRRVDQHVVAAADEGAVRLVRRLRGQCVLVGKAAPRRVPAGHQEAVVTPLATAEGTLQLLDQPLVDDDRLRRRVLDHVSDLGRPQPVADRHQQTADLAHGVEQLEPRRAVVQHCRNRVAAADAGAPQGARQAVDALVELAVRAAILTGDQRQLVGEAFGVPRQADLLSVNGHFRVVSSSAGSSGQVGS
jgi:hypothetical protein